VFLKRFGRHWHSGEIRHPKSSPFAKGRGERSPEASRQKIGRHHRQLQAGLIRLSPRGEDEGEGESGSEA